MNMGYCRDCKWWSSQVALRWERSGFRECLMVEQNDCQLEHPDTLAITSRDEQGGGSLYTASNFGCIQFKAKDNG